MKGGGQVEGRSSDEGGGWDGEGQMPSHAPPLVPSLKLGCFQIFYFQLSYVYLYTQKTFLKDLLNFTLAQKCAKSTNISAVQIFPLLQYRTQVLVL